MRIVANLVVIAGLLQPVAALAQSKAEAKAQPAEAKAAAAKPAESPAPAEPSSSEARVKGARKAGAVQGTVNAKEDQQGVKTYTFGALELEGRLKSPQILYFLRRVRAQFDPSGLGHRSFMRELSDTRRSRAVR